MSTPTARAPRVLFLGSEYAGHRARFRRLQLATERDPRIDPTYRRVSGWVPGGRLERLPALPDGLKGRLRALTEAAQFATLPRPDIIWSSATSVLGPHVWSQLGPLRRPLVLDLDWTFEQQEEFAPFYYDRPPHRGLRRRLLKLQERATWAATTLFAPATQWVAGALRREGVADERIRVLPPGVDLAAWEPLPDGRGRHEDKLRLVFVGQDFARKGGDLLVEALRGPLARHFELDIVTSATLDVPPGVRMHDPKPQLNSPYIRDLYARADLFVMPTRAECFGFAFLEALASGLPVIAGDSGAVPEFVDDGETGWLITPTADALQRALMDAIEHRDRLPAMGRRAREVAESRFNASVNDRLVVDVLLEAQALFERPSMRGSRPAR